MPSTASPSSLARAASVSRLVTVIKHPVNLLVTPHMRSSASLTSSTAYRANVTTLPATVSYPEAETYDPDDGNVYVVGQSSSTYDSVIYRVAKTGVTSTFYTFSSDAGGAMGIVYDHATRTLYVTEVGSAAPEIVAITAGGTLSVLAGGSTVGHTDGTGSSASFTNPGAIALDAKDGALYITDTDRIRRVSTSGVVSTFTPAGSLGNGNPYAYGLTWDAYDGNLYVAETPLDVIRRIAPSGALSNLAGRCAPALYSTGCAQLQRDGTGANALFASPRGIIADSTGALYVADTGNNAIRRITLDGNVTTFAGNGRTANVDGAGLNAEFDSPRAVVDAGGLIVLDDDIPNYVEAIRKVSLTGTPPPPLKTPVSLYKTATPGAEPLYIDWRSSLSSTSTTMWYAEGIGKIASLTSNGVSTDYDMLGNVGFPEDVLLGGDGTPWVLDALQGRVLHRNSSGQTLGYRVKFAGIFGAAPPDQMAYDPSGNIWVLTASSTQFAKVTPTGKVSYINVSAGTFEYTPLSITVGIDGSLWLTDSSTIAHFSPKGATLATYKFPAYYLITGPDGNIWFTQRDAVGFLNAKTGAINLYPINQAVPGCNNPTCSRGIGAIAAGPDGAFWFVEQNTGYIGRMDLGGNFSEYEVYAAHAQPYDIAPGPDGNIWFVDSGAQKIGKVNLSAL